MILMLAFLRLSLAINTSGVMCDRTDLLLQIQYPPKSTHKGHWLNHTRMDTVYKFQVQHHALVGPVQNGRMSHFFALGY